GREPRAGAPAPGAAAVARRGRGTSGAQAVRGPRAKVRCPEAALLGGGPLAAGPPPAAGGPRGRARGRRGRRARRWRCGGAGAGVEFGGDPVRVQRLRGHGLRGSQPSPPELRGGLAGAVGQGPAPRGRPHGRGL
ncbi:unnamed protein product, partial [Prorocentrum cordatum]